MAIFSDSAKTFTNMSFMGEIVKFFQENPGMAIFLTLGAGTLIGNIKIARVPIGTIPAVIITGALIGLMNIKIGGPIKSTFFALFLFTIGWSVGPLFFRSLRKEGLPQVLFAAILTTICFIVTFGCAKIMGYNPGEAAGLFSGVQTESAVIGVATETIQSLNRPQAEINAWTNILPVCYAATYIFGTVGTIWILGTLGPRLLGGLDKVRAEAKQLEAEMSKSPNTSNPAYVEANRPIVFRCYKIYNKWFNGGKTVQQLEEHFREAGAPIYVERVSVKGNIIPPSPDLVLHNGDLVVLSGRRQQVIGREDWIGKETFNKEMLDFPVETVFLILRNKQIAGKTLDEWQAMPLMHGITIKSITRGGLSIPLYAQTRLEMGDKIELMGLAIEIDESVPQMGRVIRPSQNTDLAALSFGILLGGILGYFTLKVGSVPISLTSSGGILFSGLFVGWLTTRHPNIAYMPPAAEWLLKTLGLNLYVAIVGIEAGPYFVGGLKQVGFMILVMGAIATTVPLLLGLWIGKKFFKFPSPINLGANSGSRSSTPGLAAIEDSIKSNVPTLPYSVTYAVGNLMLILYGILIVYLTL